MTANLSFFIIAYSFEIRLRIKLLSFLNHYPTRNTKRFNRRLIHSLGINRRDGKRACADGFDFILVFRHGFIGVAVKDNPVFAHVGVIAVPIAAGG